MSQVKMSMGIAVSIVQDNLSMAQEYPDPDLHHWSTENV